MKTTEQKREQAKRIISLIGTRGNWINRLFRFSQYLINHHTDMIINN